jgi:sugar phosphate isomerase/epimerase
MQGHSFSLSYYTVPELSFPQMVEVAAGAGCSHVGLRLLDGAPDGEPSALLRSARHRLEAQAALRAHGMGVMEASAARLRPATRVADFSVFLAVCAELGARHVMCNIDDPQTERAARNLDALCRLAAYHGLRVDIEFVPWMSVASLSDARALLLQLQRPNLGVAVDALHFDRSRSRLQDLALLPASCLPFLQLCDAPPCADFSAAAQAHVATQERLFPGEGSIDLRGLLSAMPPGIPLCLEIPTASLAQRMPAAQRVARAVAASRALLQSLGRSG